MSGVFWIITLVTFAVSYACLGPLPMIVGLLVFIALGAI